jgi:hypothetical protein
VLNAPLLLFTDIPFEFVVQLLSVNEPCELSIFTPYWSVEVHVETVALPVGTVTELVL